MKNKTIFDAVNEFKGDWPYKTEGMVESKSDRVGYEKDELSDYYSDNPDKLNLVWFNFTCNKKGFNALVEEMKLGLDVNEITERMFHCYIYGDKTPLTKGNKVDYTSEEFWKDAPEYYDYYLEYIPNKTNNGFCCIDSGWGYVFLDGNYPTNIDDWKIIPRPIQSNTYTQEMADSGVFPSVGMECLVNDESARIVGKTIAGEFIFEFNEGTSKVNYIDSANSNTTVKPITPPVPLIDGKAYQFDMFNGNIEKTGVSGIYSSEDDEFIYLQNVVRPFDCTNIKPLTLTGE